MSLRHRRRARVIGIAFGLSFLAALSTATIAQETADTLPAVATSTASDQPPQSPEGAMLALLVTEIDQLAAAAYQSAIAAARSDDLATLRGHVDAIYEAVWGQPSGLLERPGAATLPGWKTRWQTTFGDFDAAYGERYGNAPPAEVDPRKLGIAGRGRALRRALTARLETVAADEADTLETLIATLNNVIGWTRLDDGVTKAERQPRIDLTYRWDAPKSFFQGTADTGWLFEVQAQALNILKTSYGDNLTKARRHAGSLSTLLARVRYGAEAVESPRIPVADGGVQSVVQHAKTAGLL